MDRMRLKRTVKYSEKKSLLVLMDERYDKLDWRMSRMIFSAVEIPSVEDMDEIKRVLSEVKEGFDRKKKFHFMELDELTQSEVIDVIVGLNIRCKMYVFYAVDVSESDMKTTTLNWAIKNTRNSLSKQCTLNIMIEDAEQYRRIIRAGNLINDDVVTIIPDAFCYVFARRLDDKKTLNWYNMLCDKIRLESYCVGGICVRKKRENRLPRM